MTGSIPLDQLGANAPGGDGLRRDRWGRLLVVPPDGGKPKGYTRYTTVAKTTDEGGGLVSWKAALAVCGTLRRRGIRAQWEALIAEHGDPWYAGDEPKARCKRLVEEAAEAGGATDRREQGTALHAITALVDRGQTPQHLSAETARDIEAYQETLAAHGITVAHMAHSGLPAVEVTVVDDTFEAGGTFDRIVNVRGRARPLVCDLKTGADISYSGGSFSVQVAGYAHAEAVYEQGADPNGSTDVRAPMPDVDQDEGLVIWLPAGEGRCELYTVDLAAGWQGFVLSMAVREWRQRKGLLKVFTPPPALTVVPDSPTVVELRAWLQERINVIGRHTPEARAALGELWPLGLPTLRARDDHTPEQLAEIEKLLDEVEAHFVIPFGPPRPGTTDQERRVIGAARRAFPPSTKETPAS
jgi:hypothetical protein